MPRRGAERAVRTFCTPLGGRPESPPHRRRRRPQPRTLEFQPGMARLLRLGGVNWTFRVESGMEPTENGFLPSCTGSVMDPDRLIAFMLERTPPTGLTGGTRYTHISPACAPQMDALIQKPGYTVWSWSSPPSRLRLLIRRCFRAGEGFTPTGPVPLSPFNPTDPVPPGITVIAPSKILPPVRPRVVVPLGIPTEDF